MPLPVLLGQKDIYIIMGKTKVIFILLLSFSSINCFSQFYIREVDLSGNSKNINLDSIITISTASFDSLVLNQLSIPQYLESHTKCFTCEGRLYVSFLIFNKNLISTNTLRGLNPSFDSVLISQNKVVFNSLVNNIDVKKDHYYFITIAVSYEYSDKEDNIEIIKTDTLGGRLYIFQKSKTDIEFKTNSIYNDKIPRNIDECLLQLDSILTNASKDKIRNWDKEYFDSKLIEFRKWIQMNWEVSCGIFTNPEEQKIGLEKYFHDLGLNETCYIPSIVMNCYYNYIAGKDIRFNEEVEFFIKKQNK